MNNWDSPAEVIRKAHRMTSLRKRERKKRAYTKSKEQFWSCAKRDLVKKARIACVSSQQVDMVEDQSQTSTNTTAKLARGNKMSSSKSRKIEHKSKRKK